MTDVTMVRHFFGDRNSAIETVQAETGGSTAELSSSPGARGGAFIGRVNGAVGELISTEALTAVFSASVFSTYRVTVLDAIARRDLLSPPLALPIP